MSVVEDIASLFVFAVASEINKRYHKRRESHRLEVAKTRGVDVTQVLFAHELCVCPRKQRFMRAIPALGETISYKPAVILGELVERGVEQYLEQLGFTSGEPVCREIFVSVKKDKENEPRRFVICGTPDFVRGDAVLDVKFVRVLSVKPKEHHIRRANIYSWLFNGVPCYLLYISPGGIRSFAVVCDKDYIIAEWVNEYISLISPLWNWECKLCPYEYMCSRSVIRSAASKKR